MAASSREARPRTKSYTGKPVLVDTSAGACAAGDTWSVLSLADLNARTSEGVIAADITGSSPSSVNIGKLFGVNALPGCQWARELQPDHGCSARASSRSTAGCVRCPAVG